MNTNNKIINFIGAAILLSIVGAFSLAALSKVPPEWAGDVIKVGFGVLGGLATATAVQKVGDAPPPTDKP